MIAVGVGAATGGTRQQLAAQDRSAAAEDLRQDRAMPERRRGAETLEVGGGPLPPQGVNAQSGPTLSPVEAFIQDRA